MSGYKNGSEVLKEWGIREIELLEMVQKGLQPYNQNGLPIPPPEISRKRMKVEELYRQCKKLRQEMMSPIIDKPLLESPKQADLARARLLYALEMVGHNGPKIKNLEESIQKYEKEIAPFKKNEWGPFPFKTDQQRSEACKVLSESLFRKEDLEKFLPVQEKQITEKPAKVTEPIDFKDFISQTKISYESDIEIKIHAPGKNPKTYGFKTLGFRRDQDKGWKNLINILETGFFVVGTYLKTGNNAEYDRQQKRLELVNQKLIAFFKQEYDLSIPANFRFFRLSSADPPGTYRAIFQIIKNDHEKFERECTRVSVEELISKGTALYHEFDKQQKGPLQEKQIMAKMKIIAAEAKTRGCERHVLSAIRGSRLSDLEEVYAADMDREISKNVPAEADE